MRRLDGVKVAITERWRRASLRHKLMTLALLPLVVVLPLLVGILLTSGSANYDRLLKFKIRSELAVAHGYFERVKEGVGGQVESMAGSAQLASALSQRPDVLIKLLRDSRQQRGLDFLLLLDKNGRVVAASGGPAAGYSYAHWAAVRDALAGRSRTEVDVFPPLLLGAIDPALRQRADTPLVPTLNAVPTQLHAEERGFVIHAASPLMLPGGASGVLVGGLLLNRNLDFVDRINEIVYPEEALPLDSHGTATLFLDDVRIATNVRLFEGKRAIGTRVSAEVRTTVLDQGKTWLGRAFVVKDWYVSAYEPILDSRGQRVGMLYVGFLEKPFQHVKYLALALVIGLFALTMAAAAVFSLRLARGIFEPVERMHKAMNAIEAGDESARVGIVTGGDELAELAAHFDRLLDELDEHTAALKRWGDQLDGMVAERTRELEQACESLRTAQHRLVMTEKLAAIGQLTAGVAHEINNPVAVIQGNLDVLRYALGPDAEPVLGEIRLIQEQVFRIRLIVTKLLQFARPAEYAGNQEPVHLDLVVQDSLVLVGHQMKKGNVAVIQRHEATKPVIVDRNELQQVLINLMVNALQAMENGGTLSISSGDRNLAGVEGAYVTIADTGPGISAADRERLFTPFFTTKLKGDGNGLGLWVSLSLIERHGGCIDFDSPAGGGSAFTVWLPAGRQA
jgi:two-component system NtrC family sensor kinase